MIRKPLAKAFNGKKPSHLPLRGFTSSAVLVPLIKKKKDFHVLFTRRTDQVRDHKNQISFPGGVREKADRSLKMTALRESHEEIGLDPDQVEIMGKLADLYTPTGYRISPFVGVILRPLRLVPNPHEIQEIIQVPMNHLLEPKNMTLQKAEFFNREFDIPYFRYKQHTIWGATGRITLELLDILRKSV